MFLSLVGIIVSFIVIIFFIRKQKSFGLSLILGAVILGFFSLEFLSFQDILKTIIAASIYSFDTGQINTETIELGLLSTFIFILAKTMQETGAITKLIESFRTVFSKGGILGVIPAIYGLMPVPGGALLSAPMLDEEGTAYQLDNRQKNFLNIWFRHIWFPIFPISAAMILICSQKFSDIDIGYLILINLPSTLTAILIGYFMLRFFLKHKNPSVTKEDTGGLRGLIYLIPPIAPLFFYLILQYVGFSQTRSFLIGVVFSIALLFFLTHNTSGEYLKIIRRSFTWNLIIAIFGIMIFREMFEATKANSILVDLIQTTPTPPLVIIILIPFLLGLLTGYNLGAITLSYFLIQPFFIFTSIPILGLTSIIFISSLVGYLISPIHLCNVLSSEYLKTNPMKIYRWFIPAAMTLLCIQIVFVVLVFSLG
ncbi:MAG: DUF401 family protein [Candidatus Thermoplasmatota archaeon]